MQRIHFISIYFITSHWKVVFVLARCPQENCHAQRNHRFLHYHRQSWRRAGSFRAFDVELCFSKRRRAMSNVGQTTIPDRGRAWCYRRGGSAYPKRGSDIARGLGLRSFLSATLVACKLAESHRDSLERSL